MNLATRRCPKPVSPPPAPAASPACRRFTQLRDALSAEIVGQAALVERLLIALLADGHLLVEGARAWLRPRRSVLGLAPEADFARVQFTLGPVAGRPTGTEIWRPQGGPLRIRTRPDLPPDPAGR